MDSTHNIHQKLANFYSIRSIRSTVLTFRLTTGPWGPGSPLASEVQVQALGREGHFSSSLCQRKKHKAWSRKRQCEQIQRVDAEMEIKSFEVIESPKVVCHWTLHTGTTLFGRQRTESGPGIPSTDIDWKHSTNRENNKKHVDRLTTSTLTLLWEKDSFMLP